MKRDDFKAFAESNHLETVYLGRDWREALVGAEYIGAIISSKEDFQTSQHLVDEGLAYFADCKRVNGQGFYVHTKNYGVIYSVDEMRKHFEEFLSNDDNFSYYSADEIKRRDEALVEHPALEGESQKDHFRRVSELMPDEWLVPQYVTEPGYWEYNTNTLALADDASDIFSYSDDNWECSLILVYVDQD